MIYYSRAIISGDDTQICPPWKQIFDTRGNGFPLLRDTFRTYDRKS